MNPQPNEAVIRAIYSKYPVSLQHIADALETGKVLQTAMEGSQAESQELEKILYQNDFYEKPESRLAKQEAFQFLRVMIEDWSLNIAKTQKRISKEEMHNYIARILVFGSYVLELNSNDSDVDVICVVPNFINRQKHFFQDLAAKFEGHPSVKNLSKIITASVPIITFDFKGIPIDISFSQLNLEIVPRDIQKNLPAELINSIIEQKCRLSLLGRKNNVMIRESTPNQENFKSTLRLIKVWAKNRGISSNQMGYLGGISWAILVAKICQLFPNHYPNKLLSEFFQIFSIWDWRNASVKIVQMQTEKSTSIMTVYTPGVVFNSTSRINEITFRVLMKQLKRANDLIQKREIKKVFDKSDFFNEYPLFIQIDVCGEDSEPHHQKQYNQFLGTVQSKFVQLLSRLCNNNKADIESEKVKVVPNPRVFRKTDQKYAYQNAHFFGVSVLPQAKVEFAKAVQSWAFEILSVKRKRSNLQVFIYECQKHQLTDVEVDDSKRKKQKVRQDPRQLLTKMVKKTADGDFFKKQYIK